MEAKPKRIRNDTESVQATQRDLTLVDQLSGVLEMRREVVTVNVVGKSVHGLFAAHSLVIMNSKKLSC